MSDIFISYKREEQPVARKLADALQKKGWSVWWDPKLRTGERFDDAIERALKEAKCVIVMWSKLSVKSEYVKDEATYSRDRNKLVPITIEEVDLPFRFEGIQTGKLIDWDGSDSFPGYQKLVADIISILGPPPVELEERIRNEAVNRLVENELKRIDAEVEGERKEELKRNTVVPGFKHDIFISYSHVDNLPLGITKEEPGWVDTLVDNLKTILAQEFGQLELVNIWFDRRLNPEPASPEKNLQAVCRSALLVPIISEGYLASAWCKKERRLFVAAYMRQGKGNRIRIFKLIKTEMGHDRMPESLKDGLGYNFLKIEYEGDRLRTIGMPMSDPNDHSYFRILYDISRDIAQILRELKYERDSLDTPSERDDSGPSVFLSYSPKDQTYIRTLTDYLEKEGLSVWVDDRIEHGDRSRHTMFENIQKCDAVVVVMTPNSEVSDLVNKEYLYAYSIKKPVFPLLLEGVCFRFFEDREYYDVRDGSAPLKAFIENLRKFGR